jgi:hypothetical protein
MAVDGGLGVLDADRDRHDFKLQRRLLLLTSPSSSSPGPCTTSLHPI